MIYFMLKLRYISGDDPENENSKNKRKVKGIWLKKQRKQKRLFPKARKSIKRNIKRTFFFLCFYKVKKATVSGVCPKQLLNIVSIIFAF